MINAKFSHITKRAETTYNVIFKAEDGNNLNTICKWIKKRTQYKPLHWVR